MMKTLSKLPTKKCPRPFFWLEVCSRKAYPKEETPSEMFHWVRVVQEKKKNKKGKSAAKMSVKKRSSSRSLFIFLKNKIIFMDDILYPTKPT